MKMIIDTDPGVDDAMAIAYAAAHPGITLLGLTSVFGNLDINVTTRNAMFLAKITGADIPVFQGASGPRAGGKPEYVPHVHGVNGLGGSSTPIGENQPDPMAAPQFLADTAAAMPGQLTVCAIGPLTNIAAALDIDPGFVGNLKRLIVMGGALRTGGNVTPYAEANFRSDPEAADMVLKDRNADRVTIVGLDVTETILCRPEHSAAFNSLKSPLGDVLIEATDFYMSFHADSGIERFCYFHDPAAIIFATDPELFDLERRSLEVELSGLERGRLKSRSGVKAKESAVVMTAKGHRVLETYFDVITRTWVE